MRALVIGCMSSVVASLLATEATPRWPEASPAVLQEEVFGVRFRQMREIDGNKPALAFLRDEVAKRPSPAAKAFLAWVMLFSDGWGHPEMADPVGGIRLAEEAVAEGSVVARDVLARAKGFNLGGNAEPSAVAKLLQEAADAGATRSMARLGFFYAIGYGVPADLAKAERLVRRAAELGQPLGLVEIGQAYERGAIGGIPNFERALAYYDEASGHASPEAWAKLEELEKKNAPAAKLYRALGFLREANRATWLPPTRVREHVKTLTELGGDNPRVLVELGCAHLDGVYAKKDYAVARTYLGRAAAAGNREAEFLLAKMRLQGRGETAAPKAALADIQRLADEGQSTAMFYLGHLHYWGSNEAPGIQKDAAKAFEYVRRAAEKGHPYAVVNLGYCYEHGIGTPVNYALAAKVYWQAFTRGFPEARNRVRRLMPFLAGK